MTDLKQIIDDVERRLFQAEQQRDMYRRMCIDLAEQVAEYQAREWDEYSERLPKG